MRHIFFHGFLLIALLSLGCNRKTDKAGSSGFIEADESIVSAETSGRIERSNASEGQSISRGDTLLVIDQSKLELQLNSLKAARQVTEATLSTANLAVSRARKTEEFALSERDRIGRLIKTGSATQKQHDQLNYEAAQATIARQSAESNVVATKAQLEKTDADLALLDRQLEDCSPLSPLTGVVTELYVDQGEFVTPGKAMVKIARLDTVWVKVYLPADQFAGVKLGDAATVSTESGGTEYTGVVIWSSSESEFVPKNVQTKQSRSDLVYAVKVRIPNTDNTLKIGQPVFVTLVSQ